MKNWIFDLDGTLTKPIHDFDSLRKRLGLAKDTPILQAINDAPEPRSSWLAQGVAEWEWSLAEKAEAAPDAQALLASLGPERCAILTRNRRDIAVRTLQKIGLLECFKSELILGRDEAEPKPSPAGIRLILGRTGWSAGETTMIGDYLYDVQAGRRAGCRTILVEHGQSGRWLEWVDQRVISLTELLPEVSR